MLYIIYDMLLSIMKQNDTLRLAGALTQTPVQNSRGGKYIYIKQKRDSRGPG